MHIARLKFQVLKLMIRNETEKEQQRSGEKGGFRKSLEFQERVFQGRS